MCKLKALLAAAMSIFGSLLSAQIQTFSGNSGTIPDDSIWHYETVTVSGMGNLSGTNLLSDLIIEFRSPLGAR